MVCNSIGQTTHTAPAPAPRGQRIPYSFDPIPSAVRGDRRLKPIDHVILAILVTFAIWRRDSCWASVATIAARIPALQPGRSGQATASERTVQRSLGRLISAGYIRRERVANPDPDDPRNRTGWRFYFLFAPGQATPESPDARVTQGIGDSGEGRRTVERCERIGWRPRGRRGVGSRPGRGSASTSTTSA